MNDTTPGYQQTLKAANPASQILMWPYPAGVTYAKAILTNGMPLIAGLGAAYLYLGGLPFGAAGIQASGMQLAAAYVLAGAVQYGVYWYLPRSVY